MKKFLALLLAAAMLLPVVPAAAETEVSDGPDLCVPWFSEVTSFESGSCPVYLRKTENKTDVPLYFINGEKQIPYIAIKDAAVLMEKLYNNDYRLSVTYEYGYCILTRESGAVCMLDPEKDTMEFISGNRFTAVPNAATSLDVIELGKSDLNKTLVKATCITDTANVAYSVNLGDYGIDMIMRDEELYMPLQTFFDFFISSTAMGVAAYYNGKCIVIGDVTSLSNLSSAKSPFVEETPATDEPVEVTLNSILNDAEPIVKSQALIQFTFSELCCALDYTYGLKEKHDITSFSKTLVRYGLTDYMWSSEPKDTFRMLCKLTGGVFADGHSSVAVCSPLSSEPLLFDDLESVLGPALVTAMKHGRYNQARMKYAENGFPAYQEVGNTAFITFDQFMMNPETDYYTAEPTNTADDTILLLMYANEQLRREDCPVENVVIDLSCNIGGYCDAAACVISFFLGSANLSITDNITGAKSTTCYQFDTNRDGKFASEDDCIRDKRLFCLTGTGSFSCGNLVPAAFKASDKVTLIGRTTGGGACAVAGISTADGNGFVLSSPYCISTVINGTFYDVDAGIVPDVYISNLEHLYDRAYIVELINNLP